MLCHDHSWKNGGLGVLHLVGAVLGVDVLPRGVDRVFLVHMLDGHVGTFYLGVVVAHALQEMVKTLVARCMRRCLRTGDVHGRDRPASEAP